MWVTRDIVDFDWNAFSRRHGLPYLAPASSGKEALQVATQLALTHSQLTNLPLCVSALNCPDVTDLADSYDPRVRLFTPDEHDLVSMPDNSQKSNRAVRSGCQRLAVHFGASLAKLGAPVNRSDVIVEDCCQAPESFQLLPERSGHRHIAVFSLRWGKPYSIHPSKRQTSQFRGLLATNCKELVVEAIALLAARADSEQGRLERVRNRLQALPKRIHRCGWSKRHLDFLRGAWGSVDVIRPVIRREHGLCFFIPFVAKSALVARRIWIALSAEGYPIHLSHVQPHRHSEVAWVDLHGKQKTEALNRRLLLLFASPTREKSLEEFVAAVHRVQDNLRLYDQSFYQFRAGDRIHTLRRDTNLRWRLTEDNNSRARILSTEAATRLIATLEKRSNA